MKLLKSQEFSYRSIVGKTDQKFYSVKGTVVLNWMTGCQKLIYSYPTKFLKEYIYYAITISGKVAINLKENRKRNVGEFGAKKNEGKMSELH